MGIDADAIGNDIYNPILQRSKGRFGPLFGVRGLNQEQDGIFQFGIRIVSKPELQKKKFPGGRRHFNHRQLAFRSAHVQQAAFFRQGEGEGAGVDILAVGHLQAGSVNHDGFRVAILDGPLLGGGNQFEPPLRHLKACVSGVLLPLAFSTGCDINLHPVLHGRFVFNLRSKGAGSMEGERVNATQGVHGKVVVFISHGGRTDVALRIGESHTLAGFHPHVNHSEQIFRFLTGKAEQVTEFHVEGHQGRCSGIRPDCDGFRGTILLIELGTYPSGIGPAEVVRQVFRAVPGHLLCLRLPGKPVPGQEGTGRTGQLADATVHHREGAGGGTVHLGGESGHCGGLGKSVGCREGG